MIDLIKVHFNNKIKIEKQILKDKKIHVVKGKYDYSKSEENIYPKISKRKNLYLKITNSGASITNSIHKYFNLITGDENQNYDDFYYCDLLYALDFLESDIKYDLKDTKLTNLEFGFNIDINKSPSDFIKNHVLMYKFKAPCSNPKNNKNMRIIKFTYEEYEIKIYDKSLHFRNLSNYFKNKMMGRNILRIEVKYKSKRLLKKLGINTLSDLRNPKSIYSLFKDFLEKFNDIQIVDSYDGNLKMLNKERKDFIKYTNSHFWADKKHTGGLKSYHKKKFYNLIDIYKLGLKKMELKSLIINKFNQLMDINCIPILKIA